MNYNYDRMRLVSFAVIIFAIDQFTKLIALHYLDFDKEFIINKFLSFHRIYNQNTFMLNYTLPIEVELYKIIWALIALSLSVGIFWVTSRPAFKEASVEAELARTGLFILLGSCLGNAFDVIFRYEGVIDFLRINFTDNIPIVNFADIMIYMGEICILLSFIIIFFKRIWQNIFIHKGL